MGIRRIDNIGVAARDVVASARFFEDKLGLNVDLSPEAEPPSATVHVGDQYLYVFQTSGGTNGGPRSAELVHNPAGLDHVSFTVEDVDTSYAELRERGVEFEGEPATMEDWGIRLVAFRDPDANTLFLVQNL